MIEMVNDKSINDLLIPYKEPQECFDKHLEHKGNVKMRINRSISLPSVSTSLDYGRIDLASYPGIAVFQRTQEESGRRDQFCDVMVMNLPQLLPWSLEMVADM